MELFVAPEKLIVGEPPVKLGEMIGSATASELEGELRLT
jgi:hypothetical protein